MVTPVRPRVLLADDYPPLLSALKVLLASDCDVVGSVPDGSAAVEATIRLQPDVVVLDVNMPGLNGLDVCRQITQTNPHLKVILLSANNDTAIRDLGLTLGASAVIPKVEVSELPELLLRAIQDACFRQR